MRYTLIPLSLIFCAGCSLTGFPEKSREAEIPPNPSLVIDIFAARGFLGGTDYEQYKLVSGTMWRECGTIPGKNSTAKVQPTPSPVGLRSGAPLVPVERRVEDLTAGEQSALTKTAADFLKTANTLQEKLPSPGALFSLMEPGVVELSVQMDGSTKRYLTSVDAISEQQTGLTKALHEIFSRTRAVGPIICKSNTFFGIRRKSGNS